MALLVLGALPLGCRTVPAPGSPAPQAADPDAFAVVAEADRLAERDLWPGFDPRTVPVAIYDGERTLLFRHPSPPEGFRPLAGHEGVWTHPGRHPAVTANTSAELGGVRTATLMPPADEATLRGRAGTLIHEAFHVFQRERHPGWSANEAELFAYPVDDPALLTLRRLETEALRRALVADSGEQAAGWAAAALDLRRERSAALPAGSLAYERGSELNEGLAAYVEHLATGKLDSGVLPAEGFAPEAVRQRSYRTGLALARLLDRFFPSWKAALEQADTSSLDALLSATLGRSTADVRPYTFTSAERDSVRTASMADLGALRARRGERRSAFLEQPGWKLVVTAPRAPLFPQGFDPVNVQTVAQGEVLHTRFLKLGSDAGVVEVLGPASLTEAAGPHPLFNGVRVLTVAGLKEEPVVTQADGTVLVTAEGVRAQFRGAAVERDAQTVRVRLPPL